MRSLYMEACKFFNHSALLLGSNYMGNGLVHAIQHKFANKSILDQFELGSFQMEKCDTGDAEPRASNTYEFEISEFSYPSNRYTG